MAKKREIFNDLEDLLQKHADDFILYPRETSWENIKTELHGTPKWPALGIVFMCIVVALTISTAVNYPPKPIIAKYNSEKINPETSTSSLKIKPAKNFVQQLNTKANNEETFAKSNVIDVENLVQNSEPILNTQEVALLSKPQLKDVIKEKVTQNSKLFNQNQPISLGIQNELLETREAKLFENILSNKALNANETLEKLTISFVGNEENNPDVTNYLKEFEANQSLKPQKPSKWQYQLYITPSISDRILYDDKTRIYYSNSLAATQNLSKNVNDVIQYKPAMGTEIGVSFLYKFGRNIHLKTGLQFNIRQYFIDAYKDFNTATVAFVHNSSLDSVHLLSLFTNDKNNYKAELSNKLYQISLPIGLQWDFFNTKNFGINIGATIQPTFTLNKNVYLVSTDYKYFADGESFFRNINLNSAIELNFSFKNGKKQWFFGPQVRYQHLSTFNIVYPIKEFRLDYGVKFGFITTL